MGNITDVVTNKSIVDEYFKSSGMSLITETDPEMMSQLLRETKLSDFRSSNPVFNKILDNIAGKPQDLSDFLKMVKRGASNKLGIIKFLKLGHENQWFQHSDEIKKALHVGYLLEFLTFAQANDRIISDELMNHFLEQEENYGLKRGSFIRNLIKLGITYKSLFTAVKDLSINPCIKLYGFDRINNGKLFTKEQIVNMKKTGKVSYLEKVLLMWGNVTKVQDHLLLRINILEAGITEFNKGFKDNAMAAYALMLGCARNGDRFLKQSASLPESFKKGSEIGKLVDPDNYITNEVVTEPWMNLYISWNAAFILYEYYDLSYLLPKLFIPSQIDVMSNNYIYNRVFTLLNTIKFFMFRRLDKVKKVPRPERADIMAREWGRINKEEALRYAEEELGIDPEKFEKDFEDYFAHRFRNFVSLIWKKV